MSPVTRRLGLVVVIVLAVSGLLALIAVAPATSTVTVQNVDGPPVLVQVAGLPPFRVDCPGHETIQVPHRNLVPGDVTVSDARTGALMREVAIWADIELLIRGRTVWTVEPNSLASGGPASQGCL